VSGLVCRELIQKFDSLVTCKRRWYRNTLCLANGIGFQCGSEWLASRWHGALVLHRHWSLSGDAQTYLVDDSVSGWWRYSADTRLCNIPRTRSSFWWQSIHRRWAEKMEQVCQLTSPVQQCLSLLAVTHADVYAATYQLQVNARNLWFPSRLFRLHRVLRRRM
jgi:hypothetical protein